MIYTATGSAKMKKGSMLMMLALTRNLNFKDQN